MRMSDYSVIQPITQEEIERVKKLRDSGAAPPKANARPGDPSLRSGCAAQSAADRGERLNGREQAGLYALGGCNKMLTDRVPDGLEKRMRKLGIWWRFKGLAKQLQDIQLAVQESTEEGQMKTIAKRCRHLSVFVGMDKVADPEGTWVRIPDLNVLMGCVLEDTCGLCMKDAAEAYKCPLRAALRAMTTVTDREISPAKNGCIYKSMTVME